MNPNFSQLLVWTLIHSVWIAAALWLLTSLIQLTSPSAKRMARIRLLTISLFIISIFSVLGSKLDQPDNTIISESTILLPNETPQLQLIEWVEFMISANSIFISWIWIGGVMIGLINYSFGYYNLQRNRRSSYTCYDPRIVNPFNKIIKDLNITSTVQLRFSAMINSPATVGWIKPIIYLPISLATGLSEDEIHTILYHELIHIKRHDYLINLVLISIETLFFFNPFVLLMVKAYRNEMEFACDAAVVEVNDRRTYINALVKLQELRLPHHLGLAAKNNNSEFKTRINKMMNNNTSNRFRSRRLISVLFVCLFATAVISTAFIRTESITPSLGELPQTLSVIDTTKSENELALEAELKRFKEWEMNQHLEQKKALEKTRKALIELSESRSAQGETKSEEELTLETELKRLKELEMKLYLQQKLALAKEREALIQEMEALEKERAAEGRQKAALEKQAIEALEKRAIEKEKQAQAEELRTIKPVNESLKKAKLMMLEIQQELIKDGILNKKQKKVKLMFQYSDVLNGKEVLGDKYEKYKKIFNEYFPRYDSFSTTKVFKYK